MGYKSMLRRQLKDFPWVFLGIFLLFRIGIAEANWIPSGSMEPTLPIGDYLVVDKTAYGLSLPFVDKAIVQWDTPKRGDIITFDPAHTSDRLIKRVIGLPGDSIQVRGGVTYLNGEALAINYQNGLITEELNGKRYQTTPAWPAQFGPVVVPPGNLFVMGDNRANSADSRFWGFLPIERVRGKASYRLFTLSWLKGNHEAKFGNLYITDKS